MSGVFETGVFEEGVFEASAAAGSSDYTPLSWSGHPSPNVVIVIRRNGSIVTPEEVVGKLRVTGEVGDSVQATETATNTIGGIEYEEIEVRNHVIGAG